LTTRSIGFELAVPEWTSKNLPTVAIIGGTAFAIGLGAGFITSTKATTVLSYGGKAVAGAYTTYKAPQVIAGERGFVSSVTKISQGDLGFGDRERARTSGRILGETSVQVGSALVGGYAGAKTGEFIKSFGTTKTSYDVDTLRVDTSRKGQEYSSKRVQIAEYKKGAYTVQEIRAGNKVTGKILLGKKTVGQFKYQTSPQELNVFRSTTKMGTGRQVVSQGGGMTQFSFTQKGSQLSSSEMSGLSKLSKIKISQTQALDIVQTSRYAGKGFVITRPEGYISNIEKFDVVPPKSEFSPLVQK